MNLSPNVALSHDWLNGMRGGEKCLEVFCELYPESPVFTLFHEKGKVSDVIGRHPIRTSRLQHFPKVFTFYRYYLPFFPSAIEAFGLKDYDVVISSSHCVAKGIRKNKEAVHISYCFTPMRYAWVLFDEYFGKRGPLSKAMINFFIKRLKKWDCKSNEGVDHFVAISHHVKNRIKEFYQRDAEVIYPPVDTDFYVPKADAPAGDFYLVVSSLVPYKKIDLAIEAFNKMGKRLIVIGDGPERKELEKKAGGNVQFLGWQSDATLRDYYQKARALIFPGEEDFGIVPLEVQACGGFVIAYEKGGALETILPGRTGVFFKEPSAESLCEAVEKLEKLNLNREAARQNALRFSKERFRSEIKNMIHRVVTAKKAAGVR